MGESESAELQTLRSFRGRMLLAERDGTLYLGRNYDVYRSVDEGRSWSYLTRLPRGPMRRGAELSRLACRLLRHEVRAFARLSDGTLVAANRRGVFHGRPGDAEMAPSRVDAGEVPFMPPMRLGVGPGDVVVWGEYGPANRPRSVRLFASRDGGRSYQVAHTFSAGEVGHVHNVRYDPHLDLFWILAGDHGRQPGFGRLSADLRRFEWLVKGEQIYRAVEHFDLGDRLLYATDTEVEPNRLVLLDKESGKTEVLRGFEGTCIYACRFGETYALTTTVEPSSVNRSQWAALWLSQDGEKWYCAYRDRKDRWHPDYFQFGSIILPVGVTERDFVAFSGQAVRELDGRTTVARPLLPDGLGSR